MKTKHGLNIVIAPKEEIKFESNLEINSPYEVVPVEKDFLNWKNKEDDEITELIEENTVQTNLRGVEVVSIQLKGKNGKGMFCFKIEDNSEIDLHINRDYEGINGEEIRLLIGENCKVKVFIQEVKGTIIQRRYAKVGKDSRIEWNEFVKGTFARTHVFSELIGENSESEMRIKFYCNEDERHDCYTASLHEGKRTRSNIVTKGVSEGRSLSRGLVKIGEEAWESEGYETLKTLMLTGEADAIPNLEIHNHDVKCSHGASISNIDEEELFYLESRGVDKKEARKIIIEGFLNDS